MRKRSPTIEHLLQNQSPPSAFITPEDVRNGGLNFNVQDITDEHIPALNMQGIALDQAFINDVLESSGIALDESPSTGFTPGSIGIPTQHLQTWLAGWVYNITQARKADEAIGILTQGNWYDQAVVKQIAERTGYALEYGDSQNINLSDYNLSYELRTVIRLEASVLVSKLEEARASAGNASASELKRSGAVESLHIARNRIAFFGYNNGSNETYGILNEPNLLPYNTIDPGISTFTEWDTKTYLEITKDIRQISSGIRTQSGDRVDPFTAKWTLMLSTNKYDTLLTQNEQGRTVLQWISENYKNCTILSCPEFQGANGGEDVAYGFAEGIDDMSTDDRMTWHQVVPNRLFTIGTQQNVKNYIESYGMATAGVYATRSLLIYRITGI